MNTKKYSLNNLIKNVIKEELNKQVNSSKSIKFIYEGLTKKTIEIDSKYNLNEDNSYSRKQIEKYVRKVNNWEINNYKQFLKGLSKTPEKYQGFLSEHPLEELQQENWVTYNLKGFDVGFALHYLRPGCVDISNVYNNSDLKGIVQTVLQVAKTEGGTQLDNYGQTKNGDNFLGNNYQKAGFDKYKTYEWNDEFMTDNWDKDEFGEPDVELRRRNNHNTKYLNGGVYKNKFDSKMKKRFPDAEIDKTYEKP